MNALHDEWRTLARPTNRLSSFSWLYWYTSILVCIPRVNAGATKKLCYKSTNDNGMLLTCYSCAAQLYSIRLYSLQERMNADCTHHVTIDYSPTSSSLATTPLSASLLPSSPEKTGFVATKVARTRIHARNKECQPTQNAILPSPLATLKVEISSSQPRGNICEVVPLLRSAQSW